MVEVVLERVSGMMGSKRESVGLESIWDSGKGL